MEEGLEGTQRHEPYDIGILKLRPWHGLVESFYNRRGEPITPGLSRFLVAFCAWAYEIS